MSSIFIVKNGVKTDLSIEEIFDSEQFDEFVGVTYSASPGFINKYLSGFKKIELVVGIPESRVQAVNQRI